MFDVVEIDDERLPVGEECHSASALERESLRERLGVSARWSGGREDAGKKIALSICQCHSLILLNFARIHVTCGEMEGLHLVFLPALAFATSEAQIAAESIIAVAAAGCAAGCCAAHHWARSATKSRWLSVCARWNIRHKINNFFRGLQMSPQFTRSSRAALPAPLLRRFTPPNLTRVLGVG